MLTEIIDISFVDDYADDIAELVWAINKGSCGPPWNSLDRYNLWLEIMFANRKTKGDSCDYKKNVF